MKMCFQHSAIWVFSLSAGLLVWPGGDRGLAQITPDTTLGTENSLFTPGGTVVDGNPADLITGGAQRGANLFHSFQDFNVGEGGQVYFANPAATEIILSRVTGGNPSEILGTLGVLGNADLFLLNPNGVLFGFAAILDVNGSFIATSADSVLFNNFAFSASAATAPAPLLIITVPIGLQYGAVPGEIVNQSFVDFLGLQLQPEQTLALLGGPVIIDGGFITTEGGLIELGAVGQNSVIGLTPTNPGWVFDYDAVTEFQDIDFFYGAFLADFAGGGIHLQGANINLLEGSQLFSQNVGANQGDAISLVASGRILMTGAFPDDPSFNSGVFTIAGGSGQASDIVINAQRLQVLAGGQIGSNDSFSADGAGTGDITITAPELVEVEGVNELLDNVSFITTQATAGRGGTLTVTTGQLQLLAGGRLTTTTNGDGRGGNLVVNARDSVEIRGSVVLPGQGNFQSGLFSRSDPDAIAPAGDLSIVTNRLSIQGGGEVSVATLGAGSGGTLTIDAAESVDIAGVSDNGILPSRLVATTQGSGQAGTIGLITQRLRLQNGGQIAGATFAAGDGGDIDIRAEEFIEVSGQQNEFLSAINSGSLLGPADVIATGDAGDLTIATPRLSIQNGGEIGVSTFGSGLAGTLTVNASTIEMSGQAQIDGELKGSFLRSRTLGSGSAGGITLNPFDPGTTLTITLADDAEISAATTASGPGGTLTVSAPTSIAISGQGSLLTETTGTGTAGNIVFNTTNLTIQDGVTGSAQTAGGGIGGNVVVNVDNQFQLSNAVISAETTGASPAGTVAITAPQFFLQNRAIVTTSTTGSGAANSITVTGNEFFASGGGRLQTTTSGSGAAGSLSLTFQDVVDLTDAGTGLFANTEAGSSGAGGSIFVDPELIAVRNGAGIAVNSLGTGNAGRIQLRGNQLIVENDAFVSAETLTSRSEGIELNGFQAIALNNGRISASTAQGFAGAIAANAQDTITIQGRGGFLVEATAGGTAGDLTITTNQLSLAGGAAASVNSRQGIAGNLIVNAADVRLNNGTLSAETGLSASAAGGANINLNGLDFLVLENESLISASALNAANGGNVNLNAGFIIASPPTGGVGSDIIANAIAGNGGAVNITTTLLIGIEFRPARTPDNDITVSSEFGLAGTFVQNDLGIDPTQGLADLATNLVDPSGLIDRSCDLAAQGRLSEFVVTGRGGLPPNVGDRIGGDQWLEDLGPPALTTDPTAPLPGGTSRSPIAPSPALATALSLIATACPVSP